MLLQAQLHYQFNAIFSIYIQTQGSFYGKWTLPDLHSKKKDLLFISSVSIPESLQADEIHVFSLVTM